MGREVSHSVREVMDEMTRVGNTQSRLPLDRPRVHRRARRRRPPTRALYACALRGEVDASNARPTWSSRRHRRGFRVPREAKIYGTKTLAKRGRIPHPDADAIARRKSGASTYLIGITPNLALPAVEHAGGEPLLELEANHAATRTEIEGGRDAERELLALEKHGKKEKG